MAASDYRVFPLANNVIRVGLSFRKSDNTIITGWTGATASIGADFISAGVPLTPVEGIPAGTGYVDIPAAYSTGAHCISVVASVTNSGAAPVVIFIATTQLLTATPTPGLTEPTNVLEQIMWLYAGKFGAANFNNGGGTCETNIPLTWTGGIVAKLGQQLSTPSDTSVFRGNISPGV